MESSRIALFEVFVNLDTAPNARDAWIFRRRCDRSKITRVAIRVI
jgi:hypothetical protein